MTIPHEKLILFVDADAEWSTRISSELLKGSYKTALALSPQQALEMIDEITPRVLVLNIDNSIGYTETTLLDRALRGSMPVPALITSGTFNNESPEFIELIQQGVFDCLSKPYSAELLKRKLDQAVTESTFRHHPPNDYTLFFEQLKQLNSAQSAEALLDSAFEHFMRSTQAANGSLYLFIAERHRWQNYREKMTTDHFPSESKISELLNRISLSGKIMLEEYRFGKPGKKVTSDTSHILAVPLLCGHEMRGAVLLQSSPDAPFDELTLQTAEIIASQTGSAFVNVELYSTVHQKLHELQVISSYSEQLMGMVDKYDVIKSLCQTAVHHLDADVAGLLLVQRRAHEFMHWSRYTLSEKQLSSFAEEALATFTSSADTPLRIRRITYTPLALNQTPPPHSAPLPTLAFRYVMPLCWDDLKFGAVIFGAVHEPPNISGKIALLSSLLAQTHIALTNTKLYSDMKENYIRTIKALAIAVDAKDTYTHGHSENVMNIAEAIARELSIDEATIGFIRDAGLLHDIGKIGIPGYILNKPGPLTYEEFNGIMKTHSTLGANIVREVPFLRELYKLILYHHEHYDGNGYPDGLKGEQIPLGARILHVADAFEAMSSDRPYRLSLGRKEAIARLLEGSGTQFDPSIITAFLRVAERENWVNAQPTHRMSPFGS